jgi:hypothetical protein
VYGSRFAAGRAPGQPTAHYAANRALTTASNVLNGLGLSDAHTCYRVVRADLLKAMPLRSQRFGLDRGQRPPGQAQRSARGRAADLIRARSLSEGKKIGWRDGLAAAIHLLRFNVFAR